MEPQKKDTRFAWSTTTKPLRKGYSSITLRHFITIFMDLSSQIFILFQRLLYKKSSTVKKNTQWLIVTFDSASLSTSPPPSKLKEKYSPKLKNWCNIIRVLGRSLLVYIMIKMEKSSNFKFFNFALQFLEKVSTFYLVLGLHNIMMNVRYQSSFWRLDGQKIQIRSSLYF